MNWVRLVSGCLPLMLWLLCISSTGMAATSWSEGTGFRFQKLVPATGSKIGFTSVPPNDSGVRFTNQLTGDLYLTNAVAHNGAGLALGDVDGDGWVDLYFCNLQGTNQLYRNLGGWKFELSDLGEAACAGQISTGAALVDIDGDGDLDLLVNGLAAGTRVFLNDGKGHWTEVKESGLSRSASATSMALADIDGDGDLDLYCTHFIDAMHLADPTTRFAVAKRGDRWEVTKVNGLSTRLPFLKDRFEALPDGKVRELPEMHALYRNDGKGHFTAIQSEPGTFLDEQGKPVGPYRDWGLAVMFRDINRDGYPDLYICNDNTSPDRIWINTGKGTFRALETLKLRHTSRSSMGVDFGDLDRDGKDDFFVVDMLAREHSKRMTQLVRDRPVFTEAERIDERPQYNRNTLFFGGSDGFFTEVAFMAGVAATDWTWCPIFLDVDLDGYEDLLVTNGFEFDVMDQDSSNEIKDPTKRRTEAELKRSMQLHPHSRTRNVAFRNTGHRTFEPVSSLWGFDKEGISYGMAMADLDNDGDLDLVVNNLNDSASLYRNDAAASRIQIRLKGLAPNTEGIGARIELVGGRMTQAQEMICGGRYLSADQAVRVFAADPDSKSPMHLNIRWRNGSRTSISNIQPDHIYEVTETAASATKESDNPAAAPAWFSEITEKLGHVHAEAPFDDWSRQSLLPRRLSQLGPGVAWFDLDGDGWEDLIIAGGRGSTAACYQNLKGEGFRRWADATPAPGAQGSVMGWLDETGNRALLIAHSIYEASGEGEASLLLQSGTNVASAKTLPAGNIHLGPMAQADIDGDGDLDLFVGGRFRPGRYPEPVASTLWLNGGGKLAPDAAASQPFQAAGLVSGATFADVDGDGAPDLILAAEWGPVRLFLNRKGSFIDATTNWGLSKLRGWWTSVAAGDFDGDGRLDLVAGNWGWNTVYALYQPGPLRLFYGDWNGDGVVQIVEAWRSGSEWLPVHDRNWVARGLPGVANAFPSHEAYGKATIREILGSGYNSASFVEADYLTSTLFLNRGDHFEARPLPQAAQVAPVFSVSIADVDADGKEDVYLGQNFFGTASDISRDDGGSGLWLKGRGNGEFDPIDPSVSGVRVHGQQRGAAVADFNHDGRVDLVLSQNNGPTRLFLNSSSKPGLRVQVVGPAGNPEGIGAELRVQYAGREQGPSRLVSAGSGYWSQDSSAQVLGFSHPPSSISIRWPGGKTQTSAVPSGAQSIRIPYTP